jgi:hypothetical protein
MTLAMYLLSCTSETDPLPSDRVHVGTTYELSRNMWMPVGKGATYTYKKIDGTTSDTFQLIKSETIFRRNAKEFTGGQWKRMRNIIEIYALSYAPLTTDSMLMDMLGSINGFSFYADSSGKSTILSIGDYVTGTADVDVIRLPQNIEPNTRIQFTDDGQYYENTGVTDVSGTPWGTVTTTVTKIGTDTQYRNFYFLKDKGIIQCDVHTTQSDARYTLVSFKE